MSFNENQSKQIYDFVMQYNSDEGFKNSNEELYNKAPEKMSILNIYALEEILRYGNKELYSKFIKTKGDISDEQAVELYDGFIQLLANDENFRHYKLEQLSNNPETLSAMELFALSLINMSEVKSKESKKEESELEYSPLCPILFSTDEQIRETLETLFLGEFIHNMLDLPEMIKIKNRQKVNGVIATIDKPIIIRKVQDILFGKDGMAQFQQEVDNRYVRVKMALLLGKGKEVFAPYLKYNTNISVAEILGRRRNITSDDFKSYFINLIKEKQQRGEKFAEDDSFDLFESFRR